jgi:two-component system, OmpR family, sensor histidine kinase KdpD
MSERGSLRSYLGTAPGVGKTYAMLTDGRRRAEGGERVVIGWIERKGRTATRLQRGELDVLPAREVPYRGLIFGELDVDAAVSSGADVLLVDELAHRWPDGSRRRYEDVEEILAAGIAVLTTVNVSSLESVRDYAARLTGVGATESVPDDFLRAGEVVLVDLPPDALRRRIASGNVFSADEVGGALADYFKVSNLEALDELARAWIAGQLDRVGQDLLLRRGLPPQEEPPLVLAGDSGSDWGERVIRRATQLAREADAELLVVHVDAVRPPRPDPLVESHRALTEDLGGRYREVVGESTAGELAGIAAERRATIIVVGRHRSWLGELLHGSIAARLRRRVGDVTIEEVREAPAQLSAEEVDPTDSMETDPEVDARSGNR